MVTAVVTDAEELVVLTLLVAPDDVTALRWLIDAEQPVLLALILAD